jgi:hypothetical protein
MDKKQRKAFLETKGSLFVRVVIEEESKVQVGTKLKHMNKQEPQGLGAELSILKKWREFFRLFSEGRKYAA